MVVVVCHPERPLDIYTLTFKHQQTSVRLHVIGGIGAVTGLRWYPGLVPTEG